MQRTLNLSARTHKNENVTPPELWAGCVCVVTLERGRKNNSQWYAADNSRVQRQVDSGGDGVAWRRITYLAYQLTAFYLGHSLILVYIYVQKHDGLLCTIFSYSLLPFFFLVDVYLNKYTLKPLIHLNSWYQTMQSGFFFFTLPKACIRESE